MMKQREKTGWPYRLALVAAAFLVVGMVGGLSDPAYAGSCGTSAICTFDLTVANVTQLSPIDVRVTWDNSGSTTVFSVQWISGGPGTPKDISEFGYGSSVGVTNITGGGTFPADWTATSSANIDGFGVFLTDEMRSDGTFGISAPIVFTLASKVTSLALSTKNTPGFVGSEFVVHIAGWPSGCSGFVGEAGSTPSPSSDTSCGGTQVPEPASLLLLGSGLAGLGLWQWKRRKGVQV